MLVCIQTIVVRVPYGVTQARIEQLLNEKQGWIEKQLRLIQEREEACENLTPILAEELRELAKQAHKYIPERVAYFAPIVGVDYRTIAIRNQRTRWGSCSTKGGLNFNCLLMLAPKEVLDYVVVHELCHRKEMNHSKAFWREVERVLPDYKNYEGWLKKEGSVLMRRAHGC